MDQRDHFERDKHAYAPIVAVTSDEQGGAQSTAAGAQWESAHYPADHMTRVMARKVLRCRA